MTAGRDRQTPRQRKILPMLTDDEWRDLRVLVTEQETTIAAWTTSVILGAIQRQRREAGRSR